MENHVVIKSNKYGLLLYLDSSISYQELISEIKEKFFDASKFFSGAKMAVTFKGRHLTKEEEWEIVNLISKTAHIQIVCIIDDDETRETHCENVVTNRLHELSEKDGLFYKGTLRRRQVLESERNITIIGNVETGATVVSKGNIIVLGSAQGTLHAGASGNRKAFIAALCLATNQLKIANVASRHLFQRPKDSISFMNPEIAILEDRNIYIAPISQ